MSTPSAYQVSSLLVIEAVTHLHVGAGRGGGTADLPVQRDEFGFPCVDSSSLKGALKTALLWACLQETKDLDRAHAMVEALLGPEPEPEEAFESSVAVLDAYLVAMPVRSLKGVYAYVTSPHLLGRMLDYADLLGGPPDKDPRQALVGDVRALLKEALDKGSCLCVGDPHQLSVGELGGKIVLLEEEWFDCKRAEAGQRLLEELGLDKPLLVLPDDDARHVVTRGLLRVTRVRLRRDMKTVEEGGLWTEEYVPARTRFVTSLLFKKPPLPEGFVRRVLALSGGEGRQGEARERVDDEGYLRVLLELRLIDEETREKVSGAGLPQASGLLAEGVRRQVIKLLKDRLKNFIVVGGRETVGRGIVKLRPIPGADAERGVVG